MTLMAEAGTIPPISIATRLRIAREWRDLDQQQVADEMGISRATVSNYETGKTRPGKMAINAWAVVTRVDVEWLRNGTATPGSSDYKGQGYRPVERVGRPANRTDSRGPGKRAA